MSFKLRENKLSFLLVLILIVFGALVFPWTSYIEGRLKTMLEAQGLQNVQISISEVGLNRVIFSNITWGSDTSGTGRQSLENIAIGYSLPALISGSIQDLKISGLKMEVVQNGDKWTLIGIDQTPSTPQTMPLSFPVTLEQIEAIPLDHGKVEHSQINIKSAAWSVDAPVEFTWQKIPSPQLILHSTAPKLIAGAARIEASALEATLTLKPETKSWVGSWTMKDVTISGIDQPIPLLTGMGTISVKEDRIILKGQFDSEDMQTHSTFYLTYAPASLTDSRLTVTKTRFPWNGGILTTQDIMMPLGVRADVPITLNLQNLSLDLLLQQLTGKRAVATGSVSGNLPITIKADGQLIIHEGTLSADGPGFIKLSPDVIPGDHPQLALVRDVLKNLNYTILNVKVKGENDHRLSVAMRVEGQNPEVSGGRPVQLNVNLGGDVLDFVQQNLILFNDPRKFLEQSEHAKP